jgi:hypothetical protein
MRVAILRHRRPLIDADWMTTVMHQPRVAWDLARTTVAMAEATEEQYLWFAGQLEQRLGTSMRRELAMTRDQLARSVRPDTHSIELGRWRARIEGVLSEDPRLAQALTQLRLDASSRPAG